MMESRRIARKLKDEILTEKDFKAISECEETQLSDAIWDYYESHKDEATDLEEYARKRGLRSIRT